MAGLFKKILNRFSRNKIDWDELEESLIAGDLGVKMTMQVIDRLQAGVPGQEELLRELCEVMEDGSLCAMGGLTPMPVLSALNRFPDDFVPQEKADA